MMTGISEKELSACELLVKDVCLKTYDPEINGLISIGICGSSTQQLIHANSNINVLMIIDESLKSSTSTLSSAEKYLISLPGMSVDINVLSINEFRHSLDELYTTAKRTVAGIPADKLIASRLVWGRGYGYLFDNFRKDRYIEKLLNTYELRCSSTFNDVVGAFKVDSFDLVSMWARELSNACVDSALLSRKDLFNRPKWRIERIKRTLGDVIYSQYCGIQYSEKIRTRTEANVWLSAVNTLCKQLRYITFVEKHSKTMVDRHYEPGEDTLCFSLLTWYNNLFTLNTLNGAKSVSKKDALRYYDL